MPKVVDARARRRTIVQAACTAIAEEGLEGATLARVGRRAGLTTGAIQHYFHDKDRLLTAALRHAYHEQLVRMASRAARTPYCLVAVLGEALPLTAASRRSMRVWLAFWGRAVGDPVLAVAQRAIHRDWCARVRGELERAVAEGGVDVRLDLDAATDEVVAQIRGIWVRALLEPRSLPATRQLAQLARYLERLPVRAVATPMQADPA